MMRLLKKVLVIIIIVSNLIAVNSIATNAVEVSKSIKDEDKSIVLKFSNIEGIKKDCKWGITKDKDSSNIKEWYDLKQYDITQKSAEIILDVSNSDIKNIVKSTDIVYVYIKDAEGNIIIDAHEINIKLSITEAFSLIKSQFYNKEVPENPAYYISSLYDIDKNYYILEKVTDENIIKQYNTSTDISKFKSLIDEKKIPKNGWIEADYGYAQMDAPDIKSLPNSILSKEAGLYYVWIKAQDEESKAVYGVALIKIESDNQESVENNNDTTNNKDNTEIEERPNTEQNVNKQDKEETENKEESKDNAIEEAKKEDKIDKEDKVDKIDNTVVNQNVLPQTGENYFVILVCIVVLSIGVYSLIKYRIYRKI